MLVCLLRDYDNLSYLSSVYILHGAHNIKDVYVTIKCTNLSSFIHVLAAFFNFWRTKVIFVGPLVPLLWTSGVDFKVRIDPSLGCNTPQKKVKENKGGFRSTRDAPRQAKISFHAVFRKN